MQIGLHFEKFRMFFFVFLRIGQIKVSYYIEKSKIWEFSSGCSFFDITKVGRAWKMFGKYDAIFTIGSLACKFYRHQYQSLKLGFFLYLYYIYFIYVEKFYTLFLFIYLLQAWYINRNKKKKFIAIEFYKIFYSLRLISFKKILKNMKRRMFVSRLKLTKSLFHVPLGYNT